MKVENLRQISKNIKKSNFMKILPVGTETDRNNEAKSRFS